MDASFLALAHRKGGGIECSYKEMYSPPLQYLDPRLTNTGSLLVKHLGYRKSCFPMVSFLFPSRCFAIQEGKPHVPILIHFLFFFLIIINLSISYIHFECYSLSRFPGKHPPPPSHFLWVFPSPPSPLIALPPTI